MHDRTMKFILAVAAFICANLAPVQAEDLSSYTHVCLGSMQASMTAGNMEICKRLAESGLLNDAQRSTIYLQLAVAENDFALMSRPVVGPNRARAYILMAMAINPQDPEPVLYLATNLSGEEPNAREEILADGMKRMPSSALLKAAAAAYGTFRLEQSAQLDMCVDALDKAPDDYRVEFYCAGVYQCQNLMAPAKIVYERMLPQYKPHMKISYGLVQFPAPHLQLAFVAEQEKNYMAAVDYIRQFGRTDPLQPYPVQVHQMLANNLFEARHYSEAAVEYQAILLRGATSDAEGVKARLVVALMLAGDKKRATELITPLLAGTGKGAILKYQMQLQKYVAQNIVLNGLADRPTIDATRRCLDQGCKAKH